MMFESPPLEFLLLGAAVVLVLATVLGYYLKVYRAKEEPHQLIDGFNAYVISWWGMTALLGLFSLFGITGLLILFAFCSFTALREFLTLTTRNRDDHWVLATSFFIILPIHYFLLGVGQYGLFSTFIPVYAFLFLPIIAVARGNTENFLIRIAETQWALMIAVYCASHIAALLTLDIPGFEDRNILLIAFLIIIVQASDLCHFIWAKLIGRTKMVPRLERSKTWEGMLGGLCSGTLIGASLWWITPFSFLQAAGLAFLSALLGLGGRLVMSAIKRDKGVKDWGDLITGHGGFIDRFDSVVFAAPVFFYFVKYTWAV